MRKRNKGKTKPGTVTTVNTTAIPSLDSILQQEQQLNIQKTLALEKAFTSTDVNAIMKAQGYLKSIEQREKTDFKSILVDPQDLYSTAGGYKNKPFSLSYDVLKGMATTTIIKPIISTRKDQISTFCTPQPGKYAPGFVIQKRKKNYLDTEVPKLTKKDEQRISDIIEFLLNCGNTQNYWHADDLSTFISKIMDDSLTMDQGTFEVVRNRKGDIIEFFATDAGTYRVADSYEDDDSRQRKLKEVEVKGYTPSYVQVYQANVVAEFYPWELCFGVRNPSTDINLNGYGKSELEDMIQTVTALLNADLYNANFFKVGSAPKGILKYSGNINQNTVEDFRRQWQAQVAGVMNMHKIPLINADKLDFINTHVPNKDMEWNKYTEFLIKIACAHYKIDPSEIGFPMQGSSDAKPMFEGNNEARLKYSKDKGLKPLLKKLEAWLNKWLIWQLDPTLELRFVGIEDEKDENSQLDIDVKKLSNFMTFNEVRALYNMDPVEGGDVIANPTYLQGKMQAQQGDPNANAAMDGMFGGDQEEDGDSNPFTGPNGDDENPFMKSLEQELPQILNS